MILSFIFFTVALDSDAVSMYFRKKIKATVKQRNTITLICPHVVFTIHSQHPTIFSHSDDAPERPGATLGYAP